MHGRVGPSDAWLDGWRARRKTLLHAGPQEFIYWRMNSIVQLIMRHTSLPVFCFAASVFAVSSTFLTATPAAALESPTRALAPTPAAARAPADLRAELRTAERKRAEAVANRDVDAMRALVSGEYYHVETNGRTRSKTEVLQLLARDEHEFSSYATDDLEVRMLDGGRAAIVSGRLVAQWRNPGSTRVFRGRFVRLWTLSSDGWRNALHQITEIRPQPR